MSDCWRPRPDPAIHDPGRPGLRPHVHQAGRLHAWVFLQHQVWIDYWGNEIELDSAMSERYVENVSGFCRRQAPRIRLIVLLALAEVVLAHPGEAPAWLWEPMRHVCDDELTSEEWLEETPLLRALRRRLEPGRAEQEENR